MTSAAGAAPPQGSAWLDLTCRPSAGWTFDGAWRLLTVFEAPDRCILLLVAEHTRTANPYHLLYDALGISEPKEPRTKSACCDTEGHPPVDPDLTARFEEGLRQLATGMRTTGKARRRRH
jgi:hypothetical protein